MAFFDTSRKLVWQVNKISRAKRKKKEKKRQSSVLGLVRVGHGDSGEVQIRAVENEAQSEGDAGRGGQQAEL